MLSVSNYLQQENTMLLCQLYIFCELNYIMSRHAPISKLQLVSVLVFLELNTFFVSPFFQNKQKKITVTLLCIRLAISQDKSPICYRLLFRT